MKRTVTNIVCIEINSICPTTIEAIFVAKNVYLRVEDEILFEVEVDAAGGSCVGDGRDVIPADVRLR